MANVRLAEAKDLPALLVMGKAMHAESPRYRDLDYAPEKVEKLILNLIKAGTGLVAEHNGVVIGMLGFIVVEHFFGYDKTAPDLVVYIQPEHRLGTTLFRLVLAYETIAKGMGAKEYVLGVSTGISAESVAKAYEKLGYERSGITLIQKAR